MAGQIEGSANPSKLGRLQTDLPAGLLASAAWLDARGYYRQLLSQYVASGWLESPARGVYRRPGVLLKWQHVVTSLLLTEELPLHIGGATALEHAGHGHYARLSGPETIRLFGPAGLPAWARALSLPEKIVVRSGAVFTPPALSCVWLRNDSILDDQEQVVSDSRLAESGLRVEKWGESDWPLVYATEERAILEMLQDVPARESIYEAHSILQGLANVRPGRMSFLLKHCASIKTKRLFLALAQRQGHAWFAHLDLKEVELGKGKRAIFPDGKLDPKYQITLPADIDDHAR